MEVLELHQALLSDRAGQEAFRKALFATIRGGETVLDLGTGTGVHALFACQAGAKRVYAVDRHEVIELARAICRANGFADRVHFLHATAEETELPEQVDVIVAHHGLPGLFTLLPDARDRFLKRGGVLIPASAELFCAPLETVPAYEEKVEFWQRGYYDLTLAPVRPVAVNTMYDWRIDPGELLGEPVLLARYDFSQAREPKLSETVATQLARPGVLHGLGLWLVEWLTKEIALSAAPPTALSARLWPHSFLPIGTPLPVESGEQVSIKVQTGTGGWAKFWTWEVAVRNRKGREKARFVHSTFSSCLLAKDVLRKQALDYIPNLKPRGVALRFVLEACDGSRPLRWIEEEVPRRFPKLFRNQREAAEFVAEVISRYSA